MCRCGSDIPNRPKLAKEIEKLFGGDVVAEVLDEERSYGHWSV